jgi:hypothetical protein
VDPHHINANPDSTNYPENSDFLFDADQDADPDPTKAQLLEKVLKQAHITCILAWHLQIDADPDPVPDAAYKFWCGSGSGILFDAYADPDADPGYQNDADPDPQHCLAQSSTYSSMIQAFVWWVFYFMLNICIKKLYLPVISSISSENRACPYTYITHISSEIITIFWMDIQ